MHTKRLIKHHSSFDGTGIGITTLSTKKLKCQISISDFGFDQDFSVQLDHREPTLCMDVFIYDNIEMSTTKK